MGKIRLAEEQGLGIREQGLGTLRAMHEVVSVLAVSAVVGVDAGVGEAEAFDGAVVEEELVDDLFGVVGVGKAVPDGFGVDDQDGAVFALVEAADLVDADAVLEAGGFDGVLEGAAEFLAVLVAAAGAGGGFVALVEADEDVMFKDWHRNDWMQDGGPGCGRSGGSVRE